MSRDSGGHQLQSLLQPTDSVLVQVNYYASHRLPETDGYLALGSSLWLRHAEHEGLLSLADAAALHEHGEAPKPTTARGKREGEICLEAPKSRGHLDWNTTALWLIENIDPTKGGQARWDMDFRLRHVASKRYLAALQSTTGETKVTTTSSQVENATVFNFFSAGDCVQVPGCVVLCVCCAV